MDLTVDSEFAALCRQIAAEERTPEEWSEIESDDMFQSEHYVGGYDATEQAFCFSYYAPDGVEYWFQLTLEELGAISTDEPRNIPARPAEV